MDKEKFKTMARQAMVDMRRTVIEPHQSEGMELSYMLQAIKVHKYDHNLCLNRQQMEIWYSNIAYAAGALARINIDNFFNLLAIKHERYGVEPLVSWGPLSILIKIDAKLSRLKNMSDHDLDPDDEPVQDTLTDILGYCVLGYLITTYKITSEA